VTDIASVLSTCFERGIREFVVCAGSRNSSLVLSLLRTEGIEVWSHFEERSAGFFALGRSTDSGWPCAVVTTSGTAVAELLPAVIEAHYQGRPLIVISADRPRSFRGSGAPQAIEQRGIFGAYVEGCDDVEGDCEIFGGWSGLRPWHLNLCLEENAEPVVVSVQEGRVSRPRLGLPEVASLMSFVQEGVFRGLGVMVGGLEPEEREEAYQFLRALGVPVIADATSGLREILGDLHLVDGDRLWRESAPGKILRLGDVPTGRFWRDLEEREDIEVYSITRTGFTGLARESFCMKSNVDEALRVLGPVEDVGDVLDHFPKAKRREGMLIELLEAYPDSEPGLMRLLSLYASVEGTVFLGNSLPVREWNLFAQREMPMVNVRANRGANGIDGQLSTWLGATAGLDQSWGIFGDLTTLYDFSAPTLLPQVEGTGRVLVVINNGGGRIFERLPGLANLEEEEADVIANSHEHTFEAWAAMWGMDYLLVTSAEAMEGEFEAPMTLIEVRPKASESKRFWETYDNLR